MPRPSSLISGLAAATVAVAGVHAAPSPLSPAVDDAKLYQQRCAMCHALAPGKPSALGPNLAGIIGRTAGTTAGFAFSPALKASKLKWTPATLDRWLAGPQQLVPGTRMALAPIANPQDRAAIIAHLGAKPVRR